MLGTKDMRDKKVNPLTFLLKTVRIMQKMSNYTSYSIRIEFNPRTRKVCGFGLPALPQEAFKVLEAEEKRKYDEFDSYTSGGGVWLPNSSVIPLNDECVQILRDLILFLVNDPANHRPKDDKGRWLPVKKREEG